MTNNFRKFTPGSWRKVLAELNAEAARLRALKTMPLRADSLEDIAKDLRWYFQHNPPNYEDQL